MLSFGEIYISAEQPDPATSRTIERAGVVLTKWIDSGGQKHSRRESWPAICVSCDQPFTVTRKEAEDERSPMRLRKCPDCRNPNMVVCPDCGEHRIESEKVAGKIRNGDVTAKLCDSCRRAFNRNPYAGHAIHPSDRSPYIS